MPVLNGSNYIYLDSCASTNEALKTEELSKKLVEGTALYTDYQLKGKGQQENSWESEPGKNLLISYLFYPNFLKPDEQMWLNLAVCVAVNQVVSHFTEQKTWIKWPNDSYVNGKKIAGILIENSLQGSKLRSSVCGIGLNINQLTFSHEKAGSLAGICGREFDRKEVREYLSAELAKTYSWLKLGKREQLKQAYESSLWGKGELLKFSKGTEIFEGEILGIGQLRKLHILVNDEVQSFANKEIAFIH
mgnify:CR=1 FL=1